MLRRTNDRSVGHLEVHLGCMNAGKTTFLIVEISKHLNMGHRCLIINSDRDTRSQQILSPKTPYLDKLACDGVKLRNLSDVTDLDQYDVIGVDEGQFFDDLVESVSQWLKLGKTIIVVGLSADSDQRPFGHLLQLIPLADYFSQLPAWCKPCDNEDGHHNFASFTAYIGGSGKDGQIKIGGHSDYVSVCRKHYNLLQ